MGSKLEISHAGIALCVGRILSEYSDPEHPMSLTEIRKMLKEVYGREVSKDALRRQVEDMLAEFGPNGTLTRGEASLCEMDFGWRIVDTGCGGARGDAKSGAVPRKKGANSKLLVYADQRRFDDFEIDYLVNLVESVNFIKEEHANDLVRRLRTLQSAHRRTREPLCRGMAQNTPKPGLNEVFARMELLKTAIDEKLTVSFTYGRFGAVRAKGHNASDKMDPVLVLAGDDEDDPAVRGRAACPRKVGVSPYRMQFMNGNYYLLAAAKNAERKRRRGTDSFAVFRIDLMKDLMFSKDDSSLEGAQRLKKMKYLELIDPEAPRDYFRCGIDSFGGRKKHIVLRCSPSAEHNVIDRFSEFEGFTVTCPDEGPEAWRTVEFEANPDGIEYWVQKFLDGIELVEPKESRAKIVERIMNNPYTTCKEMPNE